MSIQIKKKITNKKIEIIKEKIETFPRYINNDTDQVDAIENIILETIFDWDSGRAEDYQIELELSKSRFTTLEFSLQQLPFCCGIIEMGALECDKSFPINELTKILDLFIQKHKGITFIINTNNRDSSILFEKALPKCKYWTLVKTFKNANSNNIISTYISNNE